MNKASKKEYGEQALTSLILLTCWARYFFGDCALHCRMCTIIPGFYTLDASSSLQVVTIKSVSTSSQRFPGGKGQSHLQLRTSDIEI